MTSAPSEIGARPERAERAQRHRPDRPTAWVLIGALLAVAGAGAWFASSRLAGPRAHLVDGNAPINRGATDRLDLSANNSPSVLANPTSSSNLVVVNRVDLQRFSCDLNISVDAGATWSPTVIPVSGENQLCFMPDAAFDRDGRLYVSFATIDQNVLRGAATNALWVTSSLDGGRTLSPPVRAAGPLTYQSRLAADPAASGRLYLSWVQAAEPSDWGLLGNDNPLVVSRSDDAGASWTAPVKVNSDRHQLAIAPTVVVAHDGLVVLAYVDLGKDRLDYIGAHDGKGGDPFPGPWSLVVARSSDRGATWDETVVDAGLVPIQRVLMAFPPRPALAVRDDNVYIAFHDARAGDADVWLWSSSDRGQHWNRPKRVNDNRPGDGTSQYLPAVAVAPDGRLDVVYYDRRADRGDVMNEVSFQSSGDSGRTFSPRLRVSNRAFDSRVGYDGNRQLAQLGDRLGLRATNDGDIAVWADTRSGFAATGKQDLARAVVAFRRQSPLRDPMRIGGLAVLLVGLAVLGGTFVRRSSNRGVAGSNQSSDASEAP